MKKYRIFFAFLMVFVFLASCASIDNSTLMRAGTGANSKLKNIPNREFTEIKEGSGDKDPIFDSDEILIKKENPNSASLSGASSQSNMTVDDLAEMARKNPGIEVYHIVESNAGDFSGDSAVVPAEPDRGNADSKEAVKTPQPVAAQPAKPQSAKSQQPTEDMEKSIADNGVSALQNATAEVRKGVNTVSDVFNSLGKNASSDESAAENAQDSNKERKDVAYSEKKAKNSNFVLIVILVAALLIGIAIAYYTVTIKRQQDE